MKLRLSSSSEDDDSLTTILDVDIDRDRVTMEQTASAFARQAISEGAQNLRILLPLQHVRIDVDGASARIISLYEENMHGLELIDVALSGAFAEPGPRRLFFLRLQQEALSDFPTAGERLCFVRVSDPLLSLRACMESLYGWRLTDDAGDSANAPRRRFWTWHHPAHALFHVRGIPPSHTLSAVERLLTGHGSDEQVSYAPVNTLHVHVRMDAFIHPPVQQAQQQSWDDDTVSATPLYIRNPATFGAFFAQIVAHCRALGNMELERGQDLLVVSIDHLTLEGGADPRHARVLFSFLVDLARIFVRPLFVHRDVVAALMEASEGDPFALVEEGPRPQLASVDGEDYLVWVPHRRTDDNDDSQPLVVEVSDEEDEEGPSRKRARLTYTCTQCRRRGARFCSRQCVRDFYMLH
jgi:hypothetical protein